MTSSAGTPTKAATVVAKAWRTLGSAASVPFNPLMTTAAAKKGIGAGEGEGDSVGEREAEGVRDSEAPEGRIEGEAVIVLEAEKLLEGVRVAVLVDVLVPVVVVLGLVVAVVVAVGVGAGTRRAPQVW